MPISQCCQPALEVKPIPNCLQPRPNADIRCNMVRCIEFHFVTTPVTLDTLLSLPWARRLPRRPWLLVPAAPLPAGGSHIATKNFPCANLFAQSYDSVLLQRPTRLSVSSRAGERAGPTETAISVPEMSSSPSFGNYPRAVHGVDCCSCSCSSRYKASPTGLLLRGGY